MSLPLLVDRTPTPSLASSRIILRAARLWRLRPISLVFSFHRTHLRYVGVVRSYRVRFDGSNREEFQGAQDREIPCGTRMKRRIWAWSVQWDGRACHPWVVQYLGCSRRFERPCPWMARHLCLHRRLCASRQDGCLGIYPSDLSLRNRGPSPRRIFGTDQ